MKNPLESTAQERKRKASDDNSDDDVVICDNTEVKENKLKQIEKKTKVDNNHVLGKETVDLTNVNNESEEGKETMEKEEEKCKEKLKKEASKVTSVEKQNKRASPQTLCNKTKVTSKKGKPAKKDTSTLKVKLGFNKYGTTDVSTEHAKTEPISFVSILFNF